METQSVVEKVQGFGRELSNFENSLFKLFSVL